MGEIRHGSGLWQCKVSKSASTCVCLNFNPIQASGRTRRNLLPHGIMRFGNQRRGRRGGIEARLADLERAHERALATASGPSREAIAAVPPVTDDAIGRLRDLNVTRHGFYPWFLPKETAPYVWTAIVTPLAAALLWQTGALTIADDYPSGGWPEYRSLAQLWCQL
jgi:hypothetical protein